jgi:hypothetical protein
MTLPPSCVGQLSEGDTATVVRFVRADVEPSALRAGGATVRLALPRKQGSQQQVAMLQTGRWLVDWSGAPELEQLDVRPDSHLQVALATVSGACVQKGDRCELVSGVRERRIRITDAN